MRVKADWERVSKSAPCSVCGHVDFCTRTVDGSLAKCMRIESDKAARGELGGWLHAVSNAQRESSPALPPKEKTKPVIDWAQRAKSMYEHKEAGAVRIAFAESLGVRIASLEELRVGCGWDFSGKAFSSWPQRDGSGKIVGISRRYGDGEKKTMQHATPGLHFETKWQSHNSSIFIVEGGSDTAALISMGLCGIGRPSNLGGVKEIVRLMANEKRRVIVVGEQDAKPEKRGTVAACPADCAGCNWCWPGRYGAISTARKLLSAFRKLGMKNRVSWVMVEGAKDTREFYQRTCDGRAYKRMIEKHEVML